MALDPQRARRCLKEFDFSGLFHEELGWDHYGAHLQISADERSFSLIGVAEKRGVAAFLCDLSEDGGIPDYTTRRKIEKQTAKSTHEHIIIYTDAARTVQVWQWVKREAGRPTACREHTYHRDQPGDSLIQKLQSIVFSLEEEEDLTLIDVTGRTRAAFDVDRVTKRFYDRFKKEHDVFLGFIEGIPDEDLLRWYASVMLNRLMFVYFIQKKGFLNNNADYLRHRLRESREQGQDLFYRDLLCPLFFDGFAKKEDERSPETSGRLGKVPYLNGGIFLKHQIEESYGEQICIPDSAFEKLFDFFDQYQWHLDERPLRADNEINPDVLGYIFEKYINQKQMGAYYTKEDITEYIGKNTIIPFLFDSAKQKCRIAFEGEQSVWRLLRSDPDRYIYEAVRKGADLPLPDEIAAGLDDVSKRNEWNKPAAESFALPTEIWREVVFRRRRCEEARAKARDGEIASVNDLITYNLNIRQFAQDVIEASEGPELLRALYHAIEKLTVLDPTCGSGAFLFAALNILEPLYEACLDRMEAFLDEMERSGEKHRADKYGDFKKILRRIDDHPNKRYFILKSIIINNLFGVDIMEEAVEICKLRLFLKLVAQIDEVEKIEPLPDIDFNIRAGNTLVGFARLDDVRQALASQLFSGDALKRIEEKAEDADSYFDLFRQMQTEQGMDSRDFADAKVEVGKRLKALEEELNGYLAESYGINVNKRADYDKWLSSHRPFHWFVEFHRIMKEGGFDVIIGNPPYVVYPSSKVEYAVPPRHYSTLSAKNLYALVFERSIGLAQAKAGVGLIVQMTVLSSERLTVLQDFLLSRSDIYTLSFPRRPESVFDGVEMPVAIILSLPYGRSEFVSSGVNRFYTEERTHAMELLSLIRHGFRMEGHRIAKIGSAIEKQAYEKYMIHRQVLALLTCVESPWILYYQEACRYWTKAIGGRPFFKRNGVEMPPPHGRTVFFNNRPAAEFAACLLNSSLFYWIYSAFSDCEHINDTIVRGFRIPNTWDQTDWDGLWTRLSGSITQHSERQTISTKEGHTIEYDQMKAMNSKPIIDEIDRILSEHYGFTDDELDFIMNYDIKYRMGLTGEPDGED